MEKNTELEDFFKEVFKRFGCSKTAQQKYNRVLSGIVERMTACTVTNKGIISKTK